MIRNCYSTNYIIVTLLMMILNNLLLERAPRTLLYFNVTNKVYPFQTRNLVTKFLFISYDICTNRSTWLQPENIKFNYMHLHSSLPNFPKAQFFTSYIYRHCTNNKHLSLPTREKVSLYFCHTLVT